MEPSRIEGRPFTFIDSCSKRNWVERFKRENAPCIVVTVLRASILITCTWGVKRKTPATWFWRDGT